MADPNMTVGRDATEVGMDQVNIWMRAQPWYQEQMHQWGQDPGHPHLAKSQQQQILRLAQANGVAVDEGNHEIDAGGNFDKKGHALRNTLIVAGIVGASIATMGAAGVFSGAAAGAGSGAAGAGAASTAGLLPATTTIGSSVLGGSGLTSAGLVGGTGLAGAGGATTLSTIGGLAGKATTASRISDLMRAGGGAVGDAGNAAEQNRNIANSQNAQANDSNIRGQQAYENELMNRSKLESDQRKESLKDLYRASYANNRTTSPFNTRGPAPLSASYMAGLTDLEKQAALRLHANPTYGTDTLPTLTPYTPYKPNTDLSGVEKASNYLSPALTIGGMALRYYGGR